MNSRKVRKKFNPILTVNFSRKNGGWLHFSISSVYIFLKKEFEFDSSTLLKTYRTLPQNF